MLCARKEGGTRCLWWINHEISDNLKGYCSNPHMSVRAKIICDGTELQLLNTYERIHPKVTQVSKLAQYAGQR